MVLSFYWQYIITTTLQVTPPPTTGDKALNWAVWVIVTLLIIIALMITRAWSELKKENQHRDKAINNIEKRLEKYDQIIDQNEQWLKNHDERIRKLEISNSNGQKIK